MRGGAQGFGEEEHWGMWRGAQGYERKVIGYEGRSVGARVTEYESPFLTVSSHNIPTLAMPKKGIEKKENVEEKEKAQRENLNEKKLDEKWKKMQKGKRRYKEREFE